MLVQITIVFVALASIICQYIFTFLRLFLSSILISIKSFMSGSRASTDSAWWLLPGGLNHLSQDDRFVGHAICFFAIINFCH